jgi:hypothetical protein
VCVVLGVSHRIPELGSGVPEDGTYRAIGRYEVVHRQQVVQKGELNTRRKCYACMRMCAHHLDHAVKCITVLCSAVRQVSCCTVQRSQDARMMYCAL